MEAKPNICVITPLLGRTYAWAVEYGIRSKVDYCARHGYAFILGGESEYAAIEAPGKRPGWLKVKLLLDNLDRFDYLFLSDADVLVTDMEKKLESVIERHWEEGISLLATEDQNDINSGNIIVKGRSEAARGFARRWFEGLGKSYPFIGFQDQPALIHLIRDTELGRSARIIPQKEINSYPAGEGVPSSSAYTEGDFLIHYAGFSRSFDQELMRRDMERMYRASLGEASSGPIPASRSRRGFSKLLRMGARWILNRILWRKARR